MRYWIVGPEIRLTPGAALAEDEDRDQGDDADRDEDVAEVERRPVLRIEEVGDVSLTQPVDEVREAPAEEESKRDRQTAGASHRSARSRRASR